MTIQREGPESQCQSPKRVFENDQNITSFAAQDKLKNIVDNQIDLRRDKVP